MKPRSRATTASFGQLAGRWILGFLVMYAFYNWYALEGLMGESTLAERVVMVVGPLPVTLSLLIAPGLFVAGVETRNSRKGRLLLFSVGAYLLAAVGPSVIVPLMPTVPEELSEPMSVSSQQIDLGRLLLPFAIAAFTPLAGVAGVHVGRVTRWWSPGKREAARRFACLALVASFWLSLWIFVTLILGHGLPAAWILASLVLPACLVGSVIAWHRGGVAGMGSWRVTGMSSTSVHPQALDRIVSSVAMDQDPAPLLADARSHTEFLKETASLLVGIRRIVAPAARVTESQVREIVAAPASKSPLVANRRLHSWKHRVGSGGLGEFCALWTCMAGGVLVASPLTGVPPSPSTAAWVAFLASGVTMFFVRRYTAPSGPARI